VSLRQLCRSRRVIALVVLLSVLSGPVAVAAGHCPTMAATCDGPCLVPSVTLPTAVVMVAEPRVGFVATPPSGRLASFVSTIPELPPKALLIPA
jgi:hypothetical protein